MTTTLRWVEQFRYVDGEPFRLMPLGTFKRGGRTLDLTPERLRAMAENYANNRPRWKIPLYFGHPTIEQPDPPAAGKIARLEFREGSGLFAYPEYTEAGKAAVATGEYQYVSPGVLWSLNGSNYTDDQGQHWDNVVEHVALTNRPFWGAHVALFSAGEILMEHDEGPMAKMRRLMQQMTDLIEGKAESASDGNRAENFKDYDTETRQKFAKKGWALPDGSYPIADKEDLGDAIKAIGRGKNNPKSTIKAHIIKRARALGATDMIPETWKEKMAEGNDMTDTMTEQTAPQITAEEFAALKAKADEFNTLKAQVETMAAENKKQAEALAAEKRTRRLEQLRARCERFVALSAKPDELAGKFAALEEHDADLFKWFEALLETADKALVEAGLFGEIASARGETQSESFGDFVAKTLAEKFGGDPAKYGEAMNEAARLKPELAEEYLNAAPARRRQIAR